MQNSRGGLSVTDTAVNRESGWVGFVDIIMCLATSIFPTQPKGCGGKSGTNEHFNDGIAICQCASLVNARCRREAFTNACKSTIET